MEREREPTERRVRKLSVDFLSNLELKPAGLHLYPPHPSTPSTTVLVAFPLKRQIGEFKMGLLKIYTNFF